METKAERDRRRDALDKLQKESEQRLDFRPVQKNLFDHPARHKCIVAHRRFGKSYFAIIAADLACRRTQLAEVQVAYVAPYANQGKEIAWRLIERQANAAGAKASEYHGKVHYPNGAVLSVLGGADRNFKHRGKYFDMAVMEEAAYLPSGGLWREVIRPALAERGGKSITIGTPTGRHGLLWEAYERGTSDKFPDWQSWKMDVYQTDVLPPEEIAALKRELKTAEWEREFMCSFDHGSEAAYYTFQMNQVRADDRDEDASWQPDQEVETAWALDKSGRLAITFWQHVGDELWSIDYLEVHNQGIEAAADQVKAKPYKYGAHYAPRKVLDVAGALTRRRIARDKGIRFQPARDMPLADGIEATRTMLKRVRFSEESFDLIESLNQYQATEDEIRDVLRDQALLNWAAPLADSVRCYATAQGSRRSDWSIPIDYGVSNG